MLCYFEPKLFWRSAMLAAILSAEHGNGQSRTGATLTGRVVGAPGKSAESITVHFRRIHQLSRDRDGYLRVVPPVLDASVLTGRDGTFTATGLPVGEYLVCARPLDAFQLGSCDWNRSSGRVSIKREEIVTVGDMTLETGRRIVFRIVDSNRRVDSAERLVIGVLSADGYYARAKVASTTVGELTYAVTVPVGLPLHVLVGTPNFSISDATGKAVPADTRGLAIEAGLAGVDTVVNLKVN